MKTKQVVLAFLVLAGMLFSCKEGTTPANERMEENHPKEVGNTDQSVDSVPVLQDSLIDNNMKGQSDTHGRDTDAGR